VFWLGADYDLTSRIKLSAGYYYISQLPGAVNGTQLNGTDRYASFAAEYFSKGTNFYAAIMNDTKSGAIAAGTGYPSTFDTYGVGIRHMF
jgi:predicted porin